jgi:hypothetical protein
MKKYLICSVAVLMALVCNKSQNNAQSEEATEAKYVDEFMNALVRDLKK